MGLTPLLQGGFHHLKTCIDGWVRYEFLPERTAIVDRWGEILQEIINWASLTDCK